MHVGTALEVIGGAVVESLIWYALSTQAVMNTIAVAKVTYGDIAAAAISFAVTGAGFALKNDAVKAFGVGMIAGVAARTFTANIPTSTP